MILFKSYKRLYFKLFDNLDQWTGKNRKNIQKELEKISLQETVAYVIEHMQDAVAVSSSFEVYDLVLRQVAIPDGLYCEFGVWKGTSINYMAKRIKTTFHGFDSFAGLPEYWRGGYSEAHFDLAGALPKVERNVQLHKGWFNETLPDFVKTHTGPLSLLHVDSDLYSSAKTVFDHLKDRIVPGTIIVFDEYFNYPSWKQHEYKAFQEFIQQSGRRYVYLCYNQLHEQVAVKIVA